jgi:hypothetical protein
MNVVVAMAVIVICVVAAVAVSSTVYLFAVHKPQPPVGFNDTGGGNTSGGNFSCLAGQTKSCTVQGCAGTQSCVNGAWSSCSKKDPYCGLGDGLGDGGGDGTVDVVDCGMDPACFSTAFRNCSKAKVRSNSSGTVMYQEIKEKKATACPLYMLVESAEGGSSVLVGSDMTCEIPLEKLSGYQMTQSELLSYCTGTLADLMSAYGGGVSGSFASVFRKQ